MQALRQASIVKAGLDPGRLLIRMKSATFDGVATSLFPPTHGAWPLAQQQMQIGSLSSRAIGPRLIIFGVWIVIAAQYWPAVPIAGASALCAWGTALCAGRAANLVLTAGIYVPLAALAVAAQLDAAQTDPSTVRFMAATVDAVAASALMLALVLFTANKLTSRGQPQER